MNSFGVTIYFAGDGTSIDGIAKASKSHSSVVEGLAINSFICCDQFGTPLQLEGRRVPRQMSIKTTACTVAATGNGRSAEEKTLLRALECLPVLDGIKIKQLK